MQFIGYGKCCIYFGAVITFDESFMPVFCKQKMMFVARQNAYSEINGPSAMIQPVSVFQTVTFV